MLFYKRIGPAGPIGIGGTHLKVRVWRMLVHAKEVLEALMLMEQLRFALSIAAFAMTHGFHHIGRLTRINGSANVLAYLPCIRLGRDQVRIHDDPLFRYSDAFPHQKW